MNKSEAILREYVLAIARGKPIEWDDRAGLEFASWMESARKCLEMAYGREIWKEGQ